jgi:sugar lactone lactonase YvrE
VNGSDFDFLGGGPFIPGVVALVTPDGKARQVADDIQFGNGMAVTPDNSTLIVAESFANRRVWAELADGPDGIYLDASGAVWVASMGNCVRVREGGEVLPKVSSDRFCFSCALGGDDGTTLFIMAAEWQAWTTRPSRTGRNRSRPRPFLRSVDQERAPRTCSRASCDRAAKA